MMEEKKMLNKIRFKQSGDIKYRLEKIINSDSSVNEEKKIEMINQLLNNI